MQSWHNMRRMEIWLRVDWSALAGVQPTISPTKSTLWWWWKCACNKPDLSAHRWSRAPSRLQTCLRWPYLCKACPRCSALELLYFHAYTMEKLHFLNYQTHLVRAGLEREEEHAGLGEARSPFTSGLLHAAFSFLHLMSSLVNTQLFPRDSSHQLIVTAAKSNQSWIDGKGLVLAIFWWKLCFRGHWFRTCAMLRVLICNLSPGCLDVGQFNLLLPWVTGGYFTLKKWVHLFFF